MNIQDNTISLHNDELYAAFIMYETLTEALVNIPTAGIVSDIARLARLLGIDNFENVIADKTLEQRFYERFFITTSPYFIPLSENSIQNTTVANGKRCFGPTNGSKTDHVAQCYRQSGFDPHALSGYPLFISSAHFDSLAFELSFMAFLVRTEIETEQEHGLQNIRLWQKEFLSQHLVPWVKKAAKIMGDTDDDFYARIVALAAAWIELDRERVA